MKYQVLDVTKEGAIYRDVIEGQIKLHLRGCVADPANLIRVSVLTQSVVWEGCTTHILNKYVPITTTWLLDKAIDFVGWLVKKRLGKGM